MDGPPLRIASASGNLARDQDVWSERLLKNRENCRGAADLSSEYENALAEVLSFILNQGVRGQLGRDHD
jgi:hypothetical protein